MKHRLLSLSLAVHGVLMALGLFWPRTADRPMIRDLPASGGIHLERTAGKSRPSGEEASEEPAFGGPVLHDPERS